MTSSSIPNNAKARSEFFQKSGMGTQSFGDQKKTIDKNPQQFRQEVDAIRKFIADSAQPQFLGVPKKWHELCAFKVANKCTKGPLCDRTHSLPLKYAVGLSIDPKYKSRPCNSDPCTFGTRCNFRHPGDLVVPELVDEKEAEVIIAPTPTKAELPRIQNRAKSAGPDRNVNPFELLNEDSSSPTHSDSGLSLKQSGKVSPPPKEQDPYDSTPEASPPPESSWDDSLKEENSVFSAPFSSLGHGAGTYDPHASEPTERDLFGNLLDELDSPEDMPEREAAPSVSLEPFSAWEEIANRSLETGVGHFDQSAVQPQDSPAKESSLQSPRSLTDPWKRNGGDLWKPRLLK